MKIAIYGKNFKKDFNQSIVDFLDYIQELELELVIYKPFFEFIKKNTGYSFGKTTQFSNHKSIKADIDFWFSIGGDGTFLESVSFVRNKEIPIIGINTGRLGFLANISQENIRTALDSIFANEFKYDYRTVLQVDTTGDIFGSFNYALNELTVHKRDSSSMITIHAYLDDEYLNTYWADGLIISTPTGSTAYSLSAGGPIIVPNTDIFIITPLAPHNLTVRPIVVSSENKLTLKIEGRSQNFLASLDYRSKSFSSDIEFVIHKADFKVKTLKLNDQNFFSILRNKLMWGLDKRTK